MSMTVIEHIEVTDPTQASLVFDSIPATYTDLMVQVSTRTNKADVIEGQIFTFNADSTTYSGQILMGYGGATGAATAWVANRRGGQATAANQTANTFSTNQYYIPNYTSNSAKTLSVEFATEGQSSYYEMGIGGILWDGTSPITSIEISGSGGGNFVQYSSATLYGITAAVEPMTYTLPVTSDLYAWYDAANTSSITSSSGFVSEWADSSGNGINAVQATGSLQPAYGPVVCNGVIVPYFNVDRLVANASLVGNALTVFTVGSKESQGGSFTYSRWASIWKYSATANDYNNTNSILGVWANTIYAYSSNTTIATISSSAVNTIQNSALRLDGSNVKIWSNGSTATGTAPTSLNADRITIGDASQGTSDSYLNGFVAEHIIYNRALTDQEVADVQTYLANKWNL